MCGINGIISKRTIQDIEKRIKKMNGSISHRGPDADTYMLLEGNTIALGHRRLSIIDLDERANQPFVSASGRWTIIYNGEIYNYKELKANLSYPFRTESDTEVLVACIEMMGIPKTIEACNGMFAFAAYDKTEKKVYLCRDRLGIKPFYYYLGEGKLIFSSEIKGILNSGFVEAVPDSESIDDYMAYRYVREPYTFFQDIRQIEAGTYLVADDRLQLICVRYWDIPEEFNMATKYDEAQVTEEFRERLEKAVYKRMIADVPLGTYLSGGVDSSLLSAIAAGRTGKELNTYTIGFPELNEFEYARMVADRYHTRHHEIVMDCQAYQEKLKSVIEYKDAPLGVPNEIPLAVMSEELRKSITVVLSGEGADELLGGYGRIFRAPFDYQNADKDCIKSFYEYFIDKYEYVPRWIRDKYLSGESSRRKHYDKVISEQFEENCNEYNVFHFFHKYHVKGLLQRVDTTTMLAGVEARVPFLDHELVEYVYREVPYDMKLRWRNEAALDQSRNLQAASYSEYLDIPKYLLKKVAYRYLPAEVIERKKVGFPVPLDQWNRELKDMARQYLKDMPWVNFGSLGELFRDCEKERIGNQIIWMFLNMGIFYRSYFSREWRY